MAFLGGGGNKRAVTPSGKALHLLMVYCWLLELGGEDLLEPLNRTAAVAEGNG
jgi:hypothetical protein